MSVLISFVSFLMLSGSTNQFFTVENTLSLSLIVEFTESDLLRLAGVGEKPAPFSSLFMHVVS